MTPDSFPQVWLIPVLVSILLGVMARGIWMAARRAKVKLIVFALASALSLSTALLLAIARTHGSIYFTGVFLLLLGAIGTLTWPLLSLWAWPGLLPTPKTELHRKLVVCNAWAVAFLLTVVSLGALATGMRIVLVIGPGSLP
jgi:hypothetical protein